MNNMMNNIKTLMWLGIQLATFLCWAMVVFGVGYEVVKFMMKVF